MGDYLKLFETHSEYETYSEGEMILPNVSYCEDNNEVHYNPWTDPRLIVRYNVEDASNSTKLYGYYAEEGEEDYWEKGVDMFTNVEIDGVDVSVETLDAAEGMYQLSSGEHTVKYTLKDPTYIGTEWDENDNIVKYGANFTNCESIVSVEIPNTVTSIYFTFEDCANLASINIPDNVTVLWESFSGCSNLTSITLGKGITQIPANFCYFNSNLTSIVIPNTVTSIGDRAFYQCHGLTSVTIPNSVTSIGEVAFSECTSLTSVTIGSGVTSIGQNAFAYGNVLTNIIVDSNNTKYDSRDNCKAIIETATNKLILGCENTVIPNTVTSIGESAFAICHNLTTITIPGSVTSIGNFAFYVCTGLTSITSLATTAPTITSNTFQSVKTNGTLTVPSGSSGYNVWMGTGNYYLGKSGWTKVEQ